MLSFRYLNWLTNRSSLSRMPQARRKLNPARLQVEILESRFAPATLNVISATRDAAVTANASATLLLPDSTPDYPGTPGVLLSDSNNSTDFDVASNFAFAAANALASQMGQGVANQVANSSAGSEVLLPQLGEVADENAGLGVFLTASAGGDTDTFTNTYSTSADANAHGHLFVTLRIQAESGETDGQVVGLSVLLSAQNTSNASFAISISNPGGDAIVPQFDQTQPFIFVAQAKIGAEITIDLQCSASGQCYTRKPND